MLCGCLEWLGYFTSLKNVLQELTAHDVTKLYITIIYYITITLSKNILILNLHYFLQILQNLQIYLFYLFYERKSTS